MDEKKQPIYIKIIYNLDAIITGITLSLATLIVNLNVIMRYFFNRPILWAEEVATGLFVWTVFIGSAYAFRNKAHLGVDILVNTFPEKISKIIRVIMDILVLLVLIMLLFISFQYVMNTMNQKTETLRLPRYVVSAAVPLGFLLSLYHSIRFIILDAKEFIKSLQNKKINFENNINNVEGGKV